MSTTTTMKIAQTIVDHGSCAFSIRAAKKADLRSIATIEQTIYATEGPWSLQDFRADFAESQCQYLVAVCGTDIVAYGAAGIYDDEAEITMLTVQPDHRRRGIAQAFLAQLILWLRNQPFSQVKLQVRIDNAGAIKMYTDAGFVLSDTLDDYYAAGVHALEYTLVF